MRTWSIGLPCTSTTSHSHRPHAIQHTASWAILTSAHPSFGTDKCVYLQHFTSTKSIDSIKHRRRHGPQTPAMMVMYVAPIYTHFRPWLMTLEWKSSKLDDGFFFWFSVLFWSTFHPPQRRSFSHPIVLAWAGNGGARCTADSCQIFCRPPLLCRMPQNRCSAKAPAASWNQPVHTQNSLLKAFSSFRALLSHSLSPLLTKIQTCQITASTLAYLYYYSSARVHHEWSAAWSGVKITDSCPCPCRMWNASVAVCRLRKCNMAIAQRRDDVMSKHMMPTRTKHIRPGIHRGICQNLFICLPNYTTENHSP